MHHLMIAAGALLCLVTLSAGGQDAAGGSAPRLVGRWKVVYTLPESPNGALQFEALESGRGWFTPLGSARSSLSEPVRGEAVWKRSSTHVTFSGDLNLPIGNVGYESIALAFEGTFASETVIKGTARLVEEPPDGGTSDGPTGRFTATRIDADKQR